MALRWAVFLLHGIGTCLVPLFFVTQELLPDWGGHMGLDCVLCWLGVVGVVEHPFVSAA